MNVCMLPKSAKTRAAQHTTSVHVLEALYGLGFRVYRVYRV